MSFSRIILVGNLECEPEFRYTLQGTPLCVFSIATSERRKDGQSAGQRESMTRFRVSLWGRQAESAAQFLAKGSAVYIEGQFQVEQYTDREGKRGCSLEVHATHLQFIGEGGRDAGSPRTAMRRWRSAVPAGVPTPRSGEWTLIDGKPVRQTVAEPEEPAMSDEEDDFPYANR